jgi:type III secretion system FlhB-like substrate exporter
MKITFDVDLTDVEQERLGKVLDCKKTELPKVLQAHGKAAVTEYIHMFLGRANIRIASDSKEVRLLMMIQYVFDGSIPDEYKISRIFHLTLSQARTLIKTVLAKYQFELVDGINDSYVKLIKSGIQREAGGSYEVSVRNSAVIDGLNQILITLDGGLPRISKKPGTSGIFVVDIASHGKLCEYLGIESEGGGNG